MRCVPRVLLAGALILPAVSSKAELAAEAALQTEVAKLQACFASEWTSCLPEFLDPSMVQLFGGASRLREFLRHEMETIKQQGIVAEFHQPAMRPTSPVMAIGNAHYARLESRLPVAHAGKRGVMVGTILAISRDQGRTWHFVRPSEQQRGLMERLYPGVWERMAITGPKFETGS